MNHGSIPCPPLWRGRFRPQPLLLFDQTNYIGAKMSFYTPNLFLSGISPEVRAPLLKHASAVELPLDTVLYDGGTVPHYAYFILSGVASIVTLMANGESAEVDFVGNEGVIGALHLLGPASVSARCIMQLPGAALRIPYQQLQHAFINSPEIHNRVLEFVQQHASAMAQIAGCNRLHSAEQRLSRWLLMAQDRTGSESLAFTHHYLAQMVGAQRSTVTVIAGELQQRGLVRYSRGVIHVVDRPGLERAACSCYPVLRSLLKNLYARDGVFAASTVSLHASSSSRLSGISFASSSAE